MDKLNILKALATIAELAAKAGAGSASLAGCCQPIAIPQITANIHNSETTHYNPKYKLFPEHF